MLFSVPWDLDWLARRASRSYDLETIVQVSSALLPLNLLQIKPDTDRTVPVTWAYKKGGDIVRFTTNTQLGYFADMASYLTILHHYRFALGRTGSAELEVVTSRFIRDLEL